MLYAGLINYALNQQSVIRANREIVLFSFILLNSYAIFKTLLHLNELWNLDYRI